MSRRRMIALAAGLALAGCRDEGQGLRSGPGEVVFGVLPTGDPAALRRKWAPVIADMQSATALSVKLYTPPGLGELVEAMKAKRADAGWFSNESGLEAVRRADGEVFARTEGPDGVDGYQSVLIVNAKGSVTPEKILKCDRTLTIGMADPMSTSGYVAPIAYFFGPHDIQPEKCFARIVRGAHDANLMAVAAGTLDVATENSIGLAANRAAGRHEADQVKVIWKSDVLPQDPIIWRRDLDPAVKEKLRQFFLTYGQGDTPLADRQRANLAPLGIGGFAPADDTHLLIVREIEAREKWALARWSGDKAKTAEAEKALEAIVAQREALEGRTRAPAGAQ
jgi:phosphonate transport system substrate-binding protein